MSGSVKSYEHAALERLEGEIEKNGYYMYRPQPGQFSFHSMARPGVVLYTAPNIERAIGFAQAVCALEFHFDVCA